jgi:hypothetical protein
MKKKPQPQPVAGEGIETGTAALAFLAGLWILVELGHKKLSR